MATLWRQKRAQREKNRGRSVVLPKVRSGKQSTIQPTKQEKNRESFYEIRVRYRQVFELHLRTTVIDRDIWGQHHYRDFETDST